MRRIEKAKRMVVRVAILLLTTIDVGRILAVAFSDLLRMLGLLG